MRKTLFKDKKRVSIFLPEEKEREFKVKAAQAGISLSSFLEGAGTATSVGQVQNTNQNNQNSGGVPEQ